VPVLVVLPVELLLMEPVVLEVETIVCDLAEKSCFAAHPEKSYSALYEGFAI
jgi:hypothetical protein